MGALFLLTSCRLDAAVTLVMEDNGTGSVTITASVDAEVVEEVPDLADELDIRDARDAGWAVTGPTPTDDGGLTITITHDFRDADEATALLSSLGGPFATMAVSRTIEGADVEASATTTLGGTLSLRGGFTGFADQQLIDAIGGTPFAAQLGDRRPQDTMTVILDAELPGDVTTSNGERHDGAIRWEVPLDGSEQEIELRTVQSAPESNTWAGPLAIAALAALAVWLVISLGFIGYVIVARRRRASARGG